MNNLYQNDKVVLLPTISAFIDGDHECGEFITPHLARLHHKMREQLYAHLYADVYARIFVKALIIQGLYIQ